MHDTIANWEAEETPEIVLKVRESQIQQLYKQTWGGLAGTFVVAVLACVTLWPVIAHWKLFLWIGILVPLIIARGYLTIRFQKTSPSGPAIYRWAKAHVLGSAAAAMMWGAPSVFLWPANSPEHQLIWPISIVAISASAVVMYCTWTPSYLAFLLLSVIPISLRLLFEGGLTYGVIGALGFVFTAILAQTGKVMHAASLRSLIIGFRNEILNAFLSEQKNRAERLNADLQQEASVREQSQKELRQRNKELEIVNRELSDAKTRLETTNQELKIAIDNVKQLSGMLPICSSCKKIRNDKGYWNRSKLTCWCTQRRSSAMASARNAQRNCTQNSSASVQRTSRASQSVKGTTTQYLTIPHTG